MAGYREGLFPMGYRGRRLITWHCPEQRALLPLDALHVPRSLARRMRKGGYRVTFDAAFGQVMRACAERESTWITRDIFRVYGELHALGKAHSVEVWVDEQLAGGLYGVHLGAAFFAESKFHRLTDMSKVALVSMVTRLRRSGFQLFEVQYRTQHLAQFGVVERPHTEYRNLLEAALATQRAF
ncbi:MAG: leucyl/phenylalanyl-tRNA--protein transferase [Bryobacterales bacterium]|nr:leucyl/phenylalanyl-tRNA--protein transferase [Bryobacterales bacterium]